MQPYSSRHSGRSFIDGIYPFLGISDRNLNRNRVAILVATKTIEQTVTFKAVPHDVYEALMDSEKHSEFTGARANISQEVEEEFGL